MPSRWQIDVLVYEETSSYPVLLLQPGRHDDHHRLFRLLLQAGLAVPAAWEWERGLWPLATGCRVELAEGSSALAVHVGGHRLTVGLQLAEPPLPWLCAACRQHQVLFVLLPPSLGKSSELIIDDVGTLSVSAQRRGCLAGTIPLAAR